jgi:tetratricopeptide (TPR) repeat protein
VVWVALEDCSSEAVLRAYMEAAASRIAAGDLIKTLASIRACVVLDGIERAACGVAAVSQVISELMSDGLGIQLVVTSQARLPEIAFETELQVERLDLEASARMLPTPECGRERVSQLLQFADGHPLTLRILAALVRHFGSTSEVIERLHGRPERPLEMPARTTQGTDSSLDICLQTAFEALGEGERSAMWALAHLPAGLATAFVSLEALGVDDPAQVTAELKRWHLVERRELTGEPLLWVLSPVRSYVRRAIDERTLPELSTLRRRLAWHFAARVEEVNSDLIHGGHIELGMALLDRELPNALAVFDLSSGKAADDAGFRAIANALASTLQTYFFSSGYFDVGAAVMEKAADLAIAAGDTREALEMLSQLISLANRGQRTDLAEAALGKARALDCTDDPLAQAFMLGIEADLERTVGRESRWDRRDGRIKAAVAAGRSYELLVQAAGGVLTHRAALALLQQACHLEDAGRPDQALPLLERAVIFFRSDEDPINAGSALQRRGNCLAYVGRITESMDSYAESAELFHKLKTVEYRSNALGEAGLLMAEHAEVVCSPQITDDVLIGGIDDIVDRIVEAVPLIRVPGNDWRYVLTRKACGMIILASLSGRTACLAQMGHRLRNEVAQVLFTREPEKWRRIGHGSPVTAHFSALAWLCEHISGISPPDRAPDLSEIEGLAIIAESMFTGDMRDLMFGWLARYLAEQRGLSGLSPGILRAATDGLGYGEPFELDGFIFSHS